MNYFLIFSKKELIYIIAVFILGVITGASLLNLYISHEVDQLILKKNSLQNEVENQKKQIEKLTTNLEEKKQNIITDIIIDLDTNYNKHIEQDIQRKISVLLESLIGKEIEKIDPHLIISIVNEREITIENDKYLVEFLSLIVKEKIELYLSVTKQ
ncbi:MAG: hypothetical protein ACOCUI_01375 [bacterium]